MRRLILATLFLCSLVLGQPGTFTASQIRYGSVLPAKCRAAIGEVYYLNVGIMGVYGCLADNVWTAIGGAGLPGPAGPAGPIGPAGPSGVDGAPGVAGYSPNTLLSGGGVAWVSGLTFRVSSATYLIGNVQYVSPETTVTLDPSDPADARIDVIVVNTSAAVEVVKGTAATPALRPDVDPSTQLSLTWGIGIAAGATTPTDVVLNDVYHENVEWTTSRVGATITLASTNTPHTGLLDVEFANSVTGNYVQFQAGAPLDLATRNTLVFYIRNDGTFASTRSLQIYFASGGNRRGSIVVLKAGAFGFVPSTIGVYQQIVIPVSLFMANGLSVNQLRIAVAGTGANLYLHIDDVTLQGGISQGGAPTGMTWADPWQASRIYTVNETVSYSGTAWVAKVTNANSAPTAVNANWAQMVSSPAVNPQTGVNYAIVTTDWRKLITLTNANPIAVTIPQAGTTGFPDGWETWVLNSGVGTVTITPAVSTIEGAATLVLTTNKSARIVSNGTNYRAVRTPVPPGNRIVTTTPDPLMEADDGKWVIYDSAVATAATLACPSATGFVRGWMTYVKNANVGTVTITVPGPCYIDNPLPITTIVMPAGQGAIIESDGTNFYTQKTSGAGVSGGIPYFSDFYTQSSSGVLAAGYAVLGGGAGAAPYSGVSNAAMANGSIDFILDGGGAVITTGAKGWVRIPYACTITGWDLTADVSGSIVLDVWKDTFANFPPTVADTIWGVKPALAAAQTNTAAGLSIAIAAGDYLRVNVDSAGTVTYVVLVLKVTKT